MTQHKKPEHEQEAEIEFRLLHSLVRNILGKCKKKEKTICFFLFFYFDGTHLISHTHARTPTRTTFLFLSPTANAFNP